MTLNFDPKKYILAFKASGVSVFVTDIHKDVYLELKALFTIENKEFRQYFLKTEFEKSLNNGLKFYTSKIEVKNYQKDLVEHCGLFKDFFKKEIKSKKQISEPVLKLFFSYTKKLCKEYTKMNFEYTDKAFKNQKRNKNIKHNLKIIMSFKDQVRSFMNLVLFEENGYSKVLFQILSKQFKLNAFTLENLVQKELLSLFQNKNIYKTNISKRQNAFISVWSQNLPIEGQEAKRIIEKFQDKPIIVNAVQGQIANTGKVTGLVKIIPVDYSNLSKLNEEIKKMKKGSVLVAETTAPELILACKKAIAIVTDLGGLISHAAIVSREFKIPCIVGTKIATKVFKDGDLVEVDANKGLVRKIWYV